MAARRAAPTAAREVKVMLTIVHEASGALLGSATGSPPPLREGVGTIAGNWSADDQWWTGSAIADREDTLVTLDPPIARVGAMILIS